MVLRSRKPDGTCPDPNEPLAIGLWKDLIKGWSVLELEPERHALMFTISSKFESEYTIDGRSDGETSSVFRMDSIQPRQIKFDLPGKDDKSVKSEWPLKNSNTLTDSEKFGNWYDIRSLSALTFAVDSIVDLCANYQEKNELLQMVTPILDLFSRDGRERRINILSEIQRTISNAWRTPGKIGTSVAEHGRVDDFDNDKAIAEIREFLKGIFDRSVATLISEMFNAIVDECSVWLDNNIKSNELKSIIATIFLYNINSKVSASVSTYNSEWNTTTSEALRPQDAKALIEKINKILARSAVT
jgi:hypothetical protein